MKQEKSQTGHGVGNVFGEYICGLATVPFLAKDGLTGKVLSVQKLLGSDRVSEGNKLMPPKFKPIKITFPVFTDPVSYAMELLTKHDFSKERSLNSIDSVINDAGEKTKRFYEEVRKYIQTAEITIEK